MGPDGGDQGQSGGRGIGGKGPRAFTVVSREGTAGRVSRFRVGEFESF